MDSEFWQQQYVPESMYPEEDSPQPQPQGIDMTIEKGSRALSDRQRLLERRLRRDHHAERRRAALTARVQQQQQQRQEALAEAQHATAHATVHGPESSLASDLSGSERPAARAGKRKKDVSFAFDLEANAREVRSGNRFTAESEVDSDAEAAVDASSSSSEEEPEPHLCRYCCANPYRKHMRRGLLPHSRVSAAGLPLLEAGGVAPHVRGLPRGCWRALRKAHTTAFAKAAERVMVAVKRGADVALLPAAPAQPLSVRAALDEPVVAVPPAHFRLCVDRAAAAGDALRVPTAGGVALAVKDRYALGVVLALAQFHYLNARIVHNATGAEEAPAAPRFVEDDADAVQVQVQAGAGPGGRLVAGEHPIASSFTWAARHGHPLVVLLTGNKGACECAGAEPAEAFTAARRFDLGVMSAALLDREDFTFVPPHGFVLADAVRALD